MLKRLNYSVQFPSTGRVFTNQIVFEPGLTAIVGPNEAGKSMIIEMIGYAWFGKAALRGAAGDYKNLSVELEQEVQGKLVHIIRKPKYERISLDGVEAAVGAEAINKFTPSFLGFGLDVFNIALVAQQDELHALTKMLPTARGKMIERLSGMDSLEKSEKDCKDQVKVHNQAAETMALMIKTPIEPTRPDDYMPSDELQETIREIEARNHQRATLERVQRPVRPVEPVSPDMDLSEDQLAAYQQDRAELVTRKAMVERQIASILVPKYTLEEIEQSEAYDQYLRDTNGRGPRPTVERDTLLEYEKVWLTPTDGECPKCGYDFRDKTVVVPPLTLAQVREQLTRYERWKNAPSPQRQFTIVNVEKEKLAHARSSELKVLQSELLDITVPDDRSADLERLRNYNRDWARYDERRNRFDADQKLWQSAQDELSTLGVQEGVEGYRKAWSEATSYEQALTQYGIDSEKYFVDLARVQAEREAADGYKRGADALKLTRQQAKQELTPSLSRESSKLLTVMTNGARNSIIVDEDFNVFVDNQPLATLSGSGKSVVNLALRIGLGRVLTSKVMSIFIGDEIDYAMDKERVEATQQMFRNLTHVLGQVILVTHKNIDADNIVSLN